MFPRNAATTNPVTTNRIAMSPSTLPGAPGTVAGNPKNNDNLFSNIIPAQDPNGIPVPPTKPIVAAVGPSGLMQANVVGLGFNRTPYGQQFQDVAAADAMEGFRLVTDAKNRGLSGGPMGIVGLPATAAPGAIDPKAPQQSAWVIQPQLPVAKGMGTTRGSRNGGPQVA